MVSPLSLKGEITKMSKIVNYIKKSTALILAITMIANVIFPGSFVNASDEQLSDLEELLIEELSEDNIEVESIDFSLDEIVVEVSVEAENGNEIFTTVEFAPGDTSITLTILEYSDEGVLEERVFIVDLSEMEDLAGADGENIEFVIEDVETGEIFECDLDEGVLSSLILSGLKAGLLVTKGLFSGGFVIILLGKVWKPVCKPKLCRPRPPVCPPVCPPINGNGNGNGNGYDDIDGTHFEAVFHDGSVLIGESLSFTEAVARLRNGQNVWSPRISEARDAARQAGNRIPIGIRNDAFPSGRRTNCYMYHIIPNPATGGRAYFGFNQRRGVR